jgi:hypothetical protein
MRRTVFVGVNLLLLGAVWLLVIAPIVGVFAVQSERLAAAQRMQAQYGAVASRGETARSARSALWSEVSTTAFLTGDTDGSLDAALQARLKSIAETAGVRVRSIRALEPKTTEGLRYFGAHIEFSGAIGALHSALKNVEQGEPFLLIETANFRVPASVAGTVATVDPPIEASLDVIAPVRGHGR